MGQVWDWVLVRMEPMPWDIIMVPRVEMKGGSFSRATRLPLRKPKTVPTPTVTKTAAIRGHWSCLKV